MCQGIICEDLQGPVDHTDHDVRDDGQVLDCPACRKICYCTDETEEADECLACRLANARFEAMADQRYGRRS